MILILYNLVFAALCSAVASASSTSDVRYELVEVHSLAKSWSRVSPADGNADITLKIALKQSASTPYVVDLLNQVSTPGNRKFGRHLSANELSGLLKPTDTALDAVLAWLRKNNHNAVTTGPGQNWISVRTKIKRAEELLRTSYSTFRHEDGSLTQRTLEWSLPENLIEHVDLIHPTTMFPNSLRAEFRPSHLQPTSSDDVIPARSGHTQQPPQHISRSTTCDLQDLCNTTYTTVNCIRCLYHTFNYEPQAPQQNGIGVLNFLNETSNRQDIAQFLDTYRPDAVSAAQAFEIISVNNGSDYQGPYTNNIVQLGTNLEGNLDAELTLAMVFPTRMTAYNTGGTPPYQPNRFWGDLNLNEPYLEWLEFALDQDSLPSVISSSYGDFEQTVPPSYARRVCTSFAQLGLRGVSVLVASGDYGVGPSVSNCVSNQDDSTKQFLPIFPASCPWVTAVGATKGQTPETATTDFASGGGFSNYFEAPDYQLEAVEKYLAASTEDYVGLFNRSGRGYPDVAAQETIWNSKLQVSTGTSASAPIFAAVISLLNDARIAEGRPPLGFLNPWLYSKAYQGMNDILNGSSFGCGTDGFPAASGWDPVCGWGTPNFLAMKSLALSI
ncbi:tripeptidyl-peptidase 1 precursor [Dissoconium aciculare CBS 342.82]|uniref:tripeptidyl-peptidase II n=1 Tax=Dissoconium aciculare CBS 342.82 TaxID=1314786 RepID=A0A6J3MAQ7_9PEZI|nr:tripeptidyl-peptidase 1 precursor [Dissoconium aciculare CBS 342.82]KAF1823912.1 tripeptidyl-peptidase 1 precursor [Dissoconium aciculare CBS 342.82]